MRSAQNCTVRLALAITAIFAWLLPDWTQAEESSIIDGASTSGVYHRYDGRFMIDGNFKSISQSNNSRHLMHEFMINLTAVQKIITFFV